MRYDMGCAKRLYADNVHPRVMLDAKDVQSLRALVRSGDGKKVMTALRGKVRRLVDAVLKSPDLNKMLAWEARQWNEPGILVRMCLDDIALVAAIDEDADTIEALRQVFAAGGNERGRKAKLGLSGTAYDLTYHYLPEDTRRGYREAAIELTREQIIRSRKSIFKLAAHNITLGTALAGLPAVMAIAGDEGVPNLDAERDEMLLFLEAVLHVAINEDGYPEEDTGYGTGVTAEVAMYCELLRRAGLYDVYARCPRYAKFGQAMLHFVQPWGEVLANTGDHGADFQQREFVLARLAKQTKDPSLLWLLGTLYYTHGMVHPQNTLPEHYIEVPLRKGFRVPATGMSVMMLPMMKGEKPPGKMNLPTAFRDRGRGIVSFRSGWGPDDTLVVFDGSQRSPGGPGHFHDSCGHFSITALGDYFAIDNGRYNNEQSAHNVMLIDGKAGRPLNGEWTCNYAFGRLTEYSPGSLVDFASVDSSHQHNCMWAWRHLGLVKGAGVPNYVWTVDDVNKGNDWADFWWTLNTSPENTIAIDGQRATITGWRKGNLLDVHFALPAPGSYAKPYELALSQDINRVSAYKYVSDPEAGARAYAKLTDQIHGALYIRPRLIAKIGGYNGRCLSLMLPRKSGEKPAIVERLDAVDNSFALRITFPKAGVTDTLIWAFEHHILRAGDVEARGNWCLVRQASKSGKLLDYTIDDGTSLSVAGKAVRLRGDGGAK